MPDRKNVIVLRKDNQEEVYGSLKDACNNHPEMSYGYARTLVFPFSYKGFQFTKVLFRKKPIDWD